MKSEYFHAAHQCSGIIDLSQYPQTALSFFVWRWDCWRILSPVKQKRKAQKKKRRGRHPTSVDPPVSLRPTMWRHTGVQITSHTNRWCLWKNGAAAWSCLPLHRQHCRELASLLLWSVTRLESPRAVTFNEGGVFGRSSGLRQACAGVRENHLSSLPKGGVLKKK